MYMYIDCLQIYIYTYTYLALDSVDSIFAYQPSNDASQQPAPAPRCFFAHSDS